MRAVHSGPLRGPLVGLVAQLALLLALDLTVGLGARGWIVGVACALAVCVLVAHGLVVSGAARLGPADRVTLARVTLAVAVAALVADSVTRPAPVPLLVALSALALALDAVDGRVARRTGTVSPFGARFDGEADAFLMLVLSVYVARSAGAWVLAIGLARYVFLAAGWVLPWMRATLPRRDWRKVVTAVEGVVLAVAAAAVVPPALMTAVLVAALVLLAESFGRDVVWLWRRRQEGVVVATRRTARRRPVVSRTLTVGACLVLWFCLVAPSEMSRLTPLAFLRLPLEAVVVVVLVVLLPPLAGRVLAALVGGVLGLLGIVTMLDWGFTVALGRPFDPRADWSYLGSAVDLLGDSLGHTKAVVVTVGASAAAVTLLVLATASALRLARIVRRHRGVSIRSAGVVGLAWVLSAVLGLQLVAGTAVASTSAADLAVGEVSQVYAGINDERAFTQAASHDAFRAAPEEELLAGLRGKDVLVVFVESYGRVAVQDSSFAPQVDDVLDAGTQQLTAAGYSSRSAFLTSPTFGGISWLAHSTLQSGLWIDNQKRYDDLVSSDRLTLSSAFKQAGWRTVADIPPDNRDWPQGTSFYHYDAIYDSRNVGYAGPKFSYAPVPDQFTLAAFRRLELAAKHRRPVMAEIDLVSSHTPWTPLPRMVGWDQLGDGSVYDGMPEQGQPPTAVWPDPAKVQAVYAQSIEYSLTSVVSFLTTYRDPNLVVVLLGDHQPWSIVSGPDAGHDVPISVISQDPAVMGRISSWGWQDGLHPSPVAPVWRMDSFRDRFLAAYGSLPPPAP